MSKENKNRPQDVKQHKGVIRPESENSEPVTINPKQSDNNIIHKSIGQNNNLNRLNKKQVTSWSIVPLDK